MANPFTVQPLGGLQTYQSLGNSAATGINNYQAEQQAMAEQEQQQALMAEQQRLMTGGTTQEQAGFMAANPEMGEAMQSGIQYASDATKQNMKESMQKIVAGYDPEQAIRERVAMVRANGGDPSDSMRELQVIQQVGPEQYRQIVSEAYNLEFGDGEVGGAMGGPTPAAIRVFEANAAAAGLQPGTPEYERAAQIELGLQPRAGISAQERISQDAQLTSDVAESGGMIEATKDAAKQSIKKSGEAYDRIATINSAIPKYDEAIRLIRDEGARSGPISVRFPSFESSTLELDAIQRELGLDVVSAVTFGALSEKELKVAMQVGLPTNLEGPALIDWIERKKTSQKKLSDYASEAAQFLGTPGNTVQKWMAKGQSETDMSNEADVDALINSMLEQ